MSSSTEPRNPLYLLLLVAGLVFVMTALAYAVIPVLEQKAIDAGEPPPPSAIRDALRAEGWKWLLYELAILIGLGVASMVWDWRRGLQTARTGSTIPDEQHPAPSP
jgi:hypothetical protein